MIAPNWFETSIIHALGWTLIHTLWQAALGALIIRLLWALISRRRARLRYGLALSAMLAILVGAIFTSRYHYGAYRLSAPHVQEWAFVFTPLPAGAELGSEDPAFGEVGVFSVEGGPLAEVYSSIEGYLPWLVLAWLMGTVFMGLRLAGGWLHLRRLSGKGIVPVPPVWAERFARLVEKMGVRRQAQLKFSRLVAEPITLKHLKPVILFPVGLLNQLTVEQVEVILLHELAHIRRWDYLANWLQSMLELLFFYHPAVWWLSAEVREAREHCCDDLALERGGASRMLYAQTLTQLTAISFTQQTKLAMSVKGINSAFTQRVKRLFGHNEPAQDWRKPVLTVVICCAILLGFGLSSRSVEVPATTNPEGLHPGPEDNSVSAATDPFQEVRFLLNEIERLSHDSSLGEPAKTLSTFALSPDTISGDTIPQVKTRLRVDKTRPKVLTAAARINSIIVLNGQILGRDTSLIRSIDPETIESISVWRGKTAVEKYGPEAESGVIEIVTKIASEKTLKFREIEGIPPGANLKKESLGDKRPLIVVDGEALGRDTSIITETEKDNIARINVLKGDQAIEKYGPEAEHGVIEIFLKPGTKNEVFPAENTGTNIRLRKIAPTPMYIVDGQIIPADAPYRNVAEFNWKQFKVSHIRPAEAVGKYGRQARLGVVVIETGTGDWPGGKPYYPVAFGKVFGREGQTVERDWDFIIADGQLLTKGQPREGNMYELYPVQGASAPAEALIPVAGQGNMYELHSIQGLHAIGLYDNDGRLIAGFPTPPEMADHIFETRIGDKYKLVASIYPCENKISGTVYSSIYREDIYGGIMHAQLEASRRVDIKTIRKVCGRKTARRRQVDRDRLEETLQKPAGQAPQGKTSLNSQPESSVRPYPARPQPGPEANASTDVARKIKGTFQAFPNPFRDETKLVFDLPQDLEARISVFSAGGQLMKILADERLEASRHEFVWNSAGAPKGAYVVVIEAGGSRITQTIQKQ